MKIIIIVQKHMNTRLIKDWIMPCIPLQSFSSTIPNMCSSAWDPDQRRRICGMQLDEKEEQIFHKFPIYLLPPSLLYHLFPIYVYIIYIYAHRPAYI